MHDGRVKNDSSKVTTTVGTTRTEQHESSKFNDMDSLSVERDAYLVAEFADREKELREAMAKEVERRVTEREAQMRREMQRASYLTEVRQRKLEMEYESTKMELKRLRAMLHEKSSGEVNDRVYAKKSDEKPQHRLNNDDSVTGANLEHDAMSTCTNARLVQQGKALQQPNDIQPQARSVCGDEDASQPQHSSRTGESVKKTASSRSKQSLRSSERDRQYWNKFGNQTVPAAEADATASPATITSIAAQREHHAHRTLNTRQQALSSHDSAPVESMEHPKRYSAAGNPMACVFPFHRARSGCDKCVLQ